ncbi:GNAT family N-acetyltransferase [Blastococcus brunescens]|uniref:GNAT family N-acetyltransferase n=1 Tax=Blastococcus brunescens TaxID=1564165 RepID=A0ABZ1AUZ2_9ACTN|nr:GNAT family N-acetyltransferase [Blastococcus sp. BMG 8361]WRL61746.1 GNAT family N-acetyltransferase [Blastococcus sp. BMG 8361]
MTSGGTLPAPLVLGGRALLLRRAAAADLPALVALLADDPFGAAREEPGDLAPYRRAFDLVDRDPAHTLLVVVEEDSVVGTLQLTLLPGLSRGGALRGQIEAVRVAAGLRGQGLGAAMIGWAVEEARRQGAALVQLTTDTRRHDARRFYERLGFVASHDGMKLLLRSPPRLVP